MIFEHDPIKILVQLSRMSTMLGYGKKLTQ